MSEREAQPEPNQPIDRRRARRPVSMNGYLIRDGGISHAIQVTDLNYGGCGVETSIELSPGEDVSLTVLNRGSIPAKVRWYSEGRAGLDFAPSLEATRKIVERKAPRAGVEAEVHLRALGRGGYRVRIHDLSTDGCKVELVERPAVDDEMSIKLDGLEVLEAVVRWVSGHTAGLKFKNPLHPAVLDLVLQRLAAAG
jgi:hypothetical protein